VEARESNPLTSFESIQALSQLSYAPGHLGKHAVRVKHTFPQEPHIYGGYM